MRELLTATVGLLLVLGGCSFDTSASWPDAGLDGPQDLDAALDAVADAPLDTRGPDASPPGTTRWLVTCGPQATDASPGYAMSGNSVAVDEVGNVYVAGTFYGPTLTTTCGDQALVAFGGLDIFLAKFDPQGKLEWAVTGGSEDDDEASGVAVSPNGKVVVVVGHFSGVGDFGGVPLTAKGKNDGFVAKLDSNGKLNWVRGLGGTLEDKLKSVVLTNSGDILVAGWFRSPDAVVYTKTSLPSISRKVTNTKIIGGTGDILVGRLKANGDAAWLTGVGGTGEDLAEGVVEASSGEIFVSGFFNSTDLKAGTSMLTTSGDNDALLLRLNAKGEVQSGVGMGGTKAEEAHGIVMSANNPVVTGWFRSQTAFFGIKNLTSFNNEDDDLFVARFTSGGAPLKLARVGDKKTQTNEGGFGIAVLPSSGHIIVTGQSRGAFTFGDAGVTQGGRIFIGRFAPALGKRAAVTASVDSGRGWSVAVDPKTGELVVTGFFDGAGDFGGNKVQAAGRHDLFVWKLTPP
jgi:hypothetical protein